MRYLQADKCHLLNLETFEFLFLEERVKPALVDVPYWFWNYNESSRHFVLSDRNKPPCELKKTSQVRLNNLVMKSHRGYAKVCVQFLDEKTNAFRKIELYSAPRSGPWVKDKGQTVVGVDFTIAEGDLPEMKTYCLFSDQVPGDIRFRPLRGLDNREILGSKNEELSLGLRYEPFEVIYKSRKLHGKSYALICGYWGILLSDDMKFDSLVAFEGVSEQTLYVNRFLCTVNPYVVKILTLLG